MGLSTGQLKFFADLIQRELGIIYSVENYFQLEKRLVDVSKALSFPNEEELYRQAQTGMHGVARQLLLDVATNNETSFYRDPKIFKVIESQIIPDIVARNSHLTVLRIWSAASSFGQEPYGLAMLLNEMKLANPKLPRFEIVATDISEAALARAREARYSQLEVQRGLPATHLVKYFTKTPDDHWVLKPEIRICVQFRKQNLLDSLTPLGSFELVLCRNVLIYQQDSKKKEIIDRIADRLGKGGYLVLGAAESLVGLSDRFDQICKDGAVYYRKKAE